MIKTLSFLFCFLSSFVLSGCSPNDPTQVTHSDTTTAIIDNSNALDIAIQVYRIAAIDVPFTASEAMDNQGNINNKACTNPDAISGGSMPGMGSMPQRGMPMFFDNCQLVNTNASGHTLIVDGECNNTADSTSRETVTGEQIRFTVPPDAGAQHSLALHGFSITRDNDNMTKASGSLHMANGDVVSFHTTTDFSGTAQNPTAGSMVISGANNTSLRLSMSTTTVGVFNLDVDSNGDGDYQDANESLFSSANWVNAFWSAIP